MDLETNYPGGKSIFQLRVDPNHDLVRLFTPQFGWSLLLDLNGGSFK